MSRQRISILLILMMAIAPVASAFSQCAGMMLSVQHVTDKLVSSATDIHSQTDQNLPEHEFSDMHCHVSGSCSFHACGGDGIVASIVSMEAAEASDYSSFEYQSFDNTILTPDLRPPILIL